MPAWLSGDSTTFVKWYTNTGGSSPSAGSLSTTYEVFLVQNPLLFGMRYYCNGSAKEFSKLLDGVRSSDTAPFFP